LVGESLFCRIRFRDGVVKTGTFPLGREFMDQVIFVFVAKQPRT
jgi:hypothetical protein